MGGHVFISYSHDERHAAESMAEQLAAAGVPVWYDYRLETGDAFWRKIQEAISRSAAFVILLTPNATASPSVAREIAYAEHKRKRIMPILLRPCPLPIEFVGIDIEDMTGNSILGPRFLDELKALATRLSPALVHVFGRQSYGVESMAWQPYGELLATGNGDMSVTLFNTSTGLEEQRLYVRDDTNGILDDAYPNWAYWSPEGRYLASWTTMGCGRHPSVWDSRTNTSQFFDIWDEKEWNSVRWRHDGLIRAQEGRVNHRNANGVPVNFSPIIKGAALRTSDDGGSVTLISRGPRWSVAWSPTDQTFLLGEVTSRDRWDGSRGAQLPALSGSRGWVTSLAWSSDGRRFALYGDIDHYADGRIEIWDIG